MVIAISLATCALIAGLSLYIVYCFFPGDDGGL